MGKNPTIAVLFPKDSAWAQELFFWVWGLSWTHGIINILDA